MEKEAVQKPLKKTVSSVLMVTHAPIMMSATVLGCVLEYRTPANQTNVSNHQSVMARELAQSQKKPKGHPVMMRMHAPIMMFAMVRGYVLEYRIPANQTNVSNHQSVMARELAQSQKKPKGHPVMMWMHAPIMMSVTVLGYVLELHIPAHHPHNVNNL
jgi:pyrroloquinoline quinone (PQQ) biosynthesis protein C